MSDDEEATMHQHLTTSYVPGEGHVGCGRFIVGGASGWCEQREGRPFVGPAGEELNRLLITIGLSRRNFYVTNLLKNFKNQGTYSAEDRTINNELLLEELKQGQPTLVVALGAEAAKWFLQDDSITTSSIQGLPLFMNTERWGTTKSAVCVVMTHPAAGLRNSEMANQVVYGFQGLSAYLQGNIQARELYFDSLTEPIYEEITSEAQLDRTLIGLTRDDTLSIDTEGWFGRPWSCQFSLRAGYAYLIGATRSDLLRVLMTRVRRIRPRLLFHNALHDLGMGRALATTGVDFTGLDFDDTMVMAYLLQVEEQGLKALCLRHCGMKMDDYTDIIGDASNDLARKYLSRIWEYEEEDYVTTQQEEFDCQIRAGRRIKVLPKLPRSPLQQAVTRVLGSQRPCGLWQDQLEDIQVAGYNRMGPFPEASLDYVSRDTAISYGCRDADGTIRLASELGRRIDAMGLRSVYDLELATYPLIDRMQRIGLLPNLNHFAQLSSRLMEEIQSLQVQLSGAVGRETFNANSGDQVANYLYDRLGLQKMKMTQSGRGSTNDKILEVLEHEHPEYPQISLIRSYREYYKLKHTFCDRLPDHVNRWPYDGRVHATFRTTRVVTGRLAASKPNVLAMPKHGKFAKDFRRGWVAAEGHMLGSWDLSQIELRIAAHLSQDPVMLSIYRGERRNPDGSFIDLHAGLAERIYGVAPKLQDESKHRLPAKAINFGFWMGQTAKGLQIELRKDGLMIDEDDAQRWLDEAHGLYVGARSYMDRMIAEARQNGYIRCLSGRIRYIGGIHSENDRTREEAERFAFSTPIQEGAQTVMKTNEAVLWRDIICPLQRAGHWIEPLLQIHDDLLLEMDEDLIFDVAPQMVACMTQSYKGLSVPIQTSSSAGFNWADMVAM